ncbi:MAG: IS1 family transposase [Spirosomataceae bacterium]
MKLLAVEADELWSFVGNKHIQQRVWLTIERRSGLLVGFYIGDRSATSAEYLWYSIDPDIWSKALFFSDD